VFCVFIVIFVFPAQIGCVTTSPCPHPALTDGFSARENRSLSLCFRSTGAVCAVRADTAFDKI